MIRNHAIDYRIFGEEMQYVEVELDPGETAVDRCGGTFCSPVGIRGGTVTIGIAGKFHTQAPVNRNGITSTRSRR